MGLFRGLRNFEDAKRVGQEEQQPSNHVAMHGLRKGNSRNVIQCGQDESLPICLLRYNSTICDADSVAGHKQTLPQGPTEGERVFSNIQGPFDVPSLQGHGMRSRSLTTSTVRSGQFCGAQTRHI